MTYKQLITPNLNVTYTGGWCQKANENSVGESGVYASAYKAWLANVQHKDTPPRGLYVPVYLSLPNGPKDAQGLPEDDVAISCPDGTIAAAAQPGTHRGLFKYPSLEAYRADYAKYNGGATVRGWGERIGTKRVIEQVKENEDMTAAERAVYNKGVVYQSIRKLSEGNILFEFKTNSNQWELDHVVGNVAVSSAKCAVGHRITCQYYCDLTYKGRKMRYYMTAIDILNGKLYGVNRLDVKIIKEYK